MCRAQHTWGYSFRYAEEGGNVGNKAISSPDIYLTRITTASSIDAIQLRWNVRLTWTHTKLAFLGKQSQTI